MVDGLSNRAIAQRLFITESTAKLHVRHILSKLSARSRAEAVAKWRDVLGGRLGSERYEPLFAARHDRFGRASTGQVMRLSPVEHGVECGDDVRVKLRA